MVSIALYDFITFVLCFSVSLCLDGCLPLRVACLLFMASTQCIVRAAGSSTKRKTSFMEQSAALCGAWH